MDIIHSLLKIRQMESIIPPNARNTLKEFASFVKKDTHAELECKILPSKIHTKDVADRIVSSIQLHSRGPPVEEHRATFSYSDGKRVIVVGAENIHKVCTTGSFRGVPLEVERKRRYFEVVSAITGKSDMIDLPDGSIRFTLRHEESLRKDFSGAPMDSASHVRILHRKSWTSIDGLVRYDFSQSKSKTKETKTFNDILKQTPNYELELEVLDRTKTPDAMVASMIKHITPILAAFQGSAFLLTNSEMESYKMEFANLKLPFLSPVTLERQHLQTDRANNILSGYTVTNKADGERCFLVVMRDLRVMRITPSSILTWTGLTAKDKIHMNDVIDGEYLADRNTFFIFDVYKFRGSDVRRLPLLRDDGPSRLGHARDFVTQLSTEFMALPTPKPFRIETKLFLSGDGPAMEEAIRTILDTKFEYPIDGLVFTPKTMSVPSPKGNTWSSVYKWKPASHNSIDFLVKFKPGESFDTVLEKRVLKGILYVSRGSDVVVHPCETMTGEYVAPELPAEYRGQNRIPSPFQPMVPKAPDAHIISLPLNEKGVPVDQEGHRIEDNTIIECAYDTDKDRWSIMRTRYDKTYQYRVLGKPQFGNDIAVADSIWTNIHVPITEDMIRTLVTSPPDTTFEDDLYYRDTLESRDRILKDVYGFHNRIKEALYTSTLKPGDSLLELAVGRAGDLLKWKRSKPSLVVGIDSSFSNLMSPRQGACVRYVKENMKHPLPPVLFFQGDMTQPLFQGDNVYANIVAGTQPPTTPYLRQFAGHTEFDAISCQFAIHYACESEETFKTFATNLETHGKRSFFGTCLDGASVYALLLGKQSHMFRVGRQVFGEFVKQYDDGVGWTEEFGQPISVHLESFEQPQKEYLVPFAKLTQRLEEAGYELVETKLFSDHYAEQNQVLFSQEHQAFSFLHRSFVFKKSDKPKITEKQEVTVPVMEESKDERSEPEPGVVAKKPVKKRIIKKAEPGSEPVLFLGADEGKGEWRVLSNMYQAPFQIDSITFPTVEHYFQWSKAKAFGDGATADKILKTPSPKAVKALGKKVKDFVEEEWSAKKDGIMRMALKSKFIQHPDLKTKLLETGTRPVGEASARDKYWGIGTSADTAKANDPSKWPGKNVTGKLLMELRTEFKE